MQKHYLYDDEATAPLCNEQGGLNVSRLFADHGDLRVQANAQSALDQLLAHVRERHLVDTFDMTGIVWATHDPFKNRDGVIPFGLDLASDEVRGVCRMAAQMGAGDLFAAHPDYARVNAFVTDALQQCSGMDMERVRKEMLHDALIAFMGADLMRRGARLTKAIGATVIGVSACVAADNGETTVGLLAYHEHVTTGPVRMWLPGETSVPLGKGPLEFTSFGEWTAIGSKFDDHPIMRLYSNMLPTDSYGRTGGVA